MATKKTRAKKKAEPPDKQAGTGRDAKTGQFLPGHSGNPAGRPRGYDYRAIMTECYGETFVKKALVKTFAMLLVRVEKKLDVHAAKLLTDLLCDKDAQRFAFELPHGPPVPPAEDLARGIETLAALSKEVLGR